MFIVLSLTALIKPHLSNFPAMLWLVYPFALWACWRLAVALAYWVSDPGAAWIMRRFAKPMPPSNPVTDSAAA
ncbi:hypothetical protein HC761_01505 [bacterium]|nr:hypothetical protein [bacterium]